MSLFLTIYLQNGCYPESQVRKCFFSVLLLSVGLAAIRIIKFEVWLSTYLQELNHLHDLLKFFVQPLIRFVYSQNRYQLQIHALEHTCPWYFCCLSCYCCYTIWQIWHLLLDNFLEIERYKHLYFNTFFLFLPIYKKKMPMFPQFILSLLTVCLYEYVRENNQVNIDPRPKMKDSRRK